MIYYDIHTHRTPQSLNVKAVKCIDLRQPFTPCPNELYAAGIHPWYADRKQLECLYKWASHPQIALIGEAGLDKRTHTPFDMQKELFKTQIQLSEEVHKPMIIHCVKAWGDLLGIRKDTQAVMPWIIHGFRGKEELSRQLLNSGMYLSFGMFYHVDALNAAWQARRLLIETDDKIVDIGNIYRQIAEELRISENALSQEVGKVFFFLLSSTH